MRFVYRNRKLALFGMFFLFGAMMILIKFTEFSPTCLFREEAQQGPMMVRDQVDIMTIAKLDLLSISEYALQSIYLCSMPLASSLSLSSFSRFSFFLYIEIHSWQRQALLSVSSTDAIDFHWWCTTIRYHINASHA